MLEVGAFLGGDLNGQPGLAGAARTGERDLLWKTQTAGETFGVVIDDPGQECYLPSSDTGLYCLNGQTGELLWKYFSGGKLTELPDLTERFVYLQIPQIIIISPGGHDSMFDGRFQAVTKILAELARTVDQQRSSLAPEG